MNVNSYTAIGLKQDNIISQTTLNYPSRNIEKVLLILIATFGLLGSAYIFSASSSSNMNPKYNTAAAIPFVKSDLEDDEAIKARFKNFVKIEGSKKAGEKLTFTFKKDRKASRYVLEMGTGERMIITGDTWPFVYKKPGVYLLELKEIKKGLISTIATKKLKIK